MTHKKRLNRRLKKKMRPRTPTKKNTLGSDWPTDTDGFIAVFKTLLPDEWTDYGRAVIEKHGTVAGATDIIEKALTGRNKTKKVYAPFELVSLIRGMVTMYRDQKRDGQVKDVCRSLGERLVNIEVIPEAAPVLVTRLAEALKAVMDWGREVGMDGGPELTRALVELGLPVAVVAEWLGVSRPTVYAMLKTPK